MPFNACELEIDLFCKGTRVLDDVSLDGTREISRACAGLGSGLEIVEPYLRGVKEEVGMLVGVQLAPERDCSRYDRLIGMGVDRLSFCFECFDAEWFARVCPGKERMLGQKFFFDAMEYCAARMRKGAVSGEVIAGIEPLEATHQAIDYIASIGALPTVSIFRPTIGSGMEAWASPRYEEMRDVMQHVYEGWRRAVKLVTRRLFSRRMQPRPLRNSDSPTGPSDSSPVVPSTDA
ncbi:MAG: hypothetical protein HYX76_12155 [Acidobacteria bacterium]|nr:hypothetical protein [Acidobacteriota bacterium]